MHCIICDELLTDFEATRRVQGTHRYVDLCKLCFKAVDSRLPVIERRDLATSGELDDDPNTEGTDEILYNNYRVLGSDEYIID